MYPSRSGVSSRTMKLQLSQQIDPPLANQQSQGLCVDPPAGPFSQGLTSPSGSESAGTSSDTSFGLKRSSSVVGKAEKGGTGNKRPRKDENNVTEKGPKAKSTRGSRCVPGVLSQLRTSSRVQY